MNLIVQILIIAVIAYVIAAIVIYKKKLFTKYIDWYGPIMAIKTENVSFFDSFIKYKKFFQIYGSFGIATVVLVGSFVVCMLVFGVKFIYETKPAPTGIFEPQNIFMIPGLNDFIPATISVFLALICAMVVHEFGHAILCRIEGIKIKSTGILFAAIPIGAFVDPNNEEVEKAPVLSRMRMYGAGITNNLVFGLICFGLMVFIVSTCVSGNGNVLIGSVVQGSPAYCSILEPGDYIRSINGMEITSSDDFRNIINASSPGQTLFVITESSSGIQTTHKVILSERPINTGMNPTSGYIGLSDIDGNTLSRTVRQMISPIGLLAIMASPVGHDQISMILKPLIFNTNQMDIYATPFNGTWEIIHFLFWASWMNINVGLFNAIPMIPLDGGYIFKDGTCKLLGKTRYVKHCGKIAVGISVCMFSLIVAMYLIPYLSH